MARLGIGADAVSCARLETRCRGLRSVSYGSAPPSVRSNDLARYAPLLVQLPFDRKWQTISRRSACRRHRRQFGTSIAKKSQPVAASPGGEVLALWRELVRIERRGANFGGRGVTCSLKERRVSTETWGAWYHEVKEDVKRSRLYRLKSFNQGTVIKRIKSDEIWGTTRKGP